MSDAPIVSHIASPEYRDGIDGMMCKVPGCKRWKSGAGSPFCDDHGLSAWIPAASDPPKMFEDIRRDKP